MTLGTVCRIVAIKARIGTAHANYLEVMQNPYPRWITLWVMA